MPKQEDKKDYSKVYGEDKYKILLEFLDSTLTRLEADISTHIERLDLFGKIYEGRNTLGIKPYEEWIESHTGVTATACDILQARLYGTIWTPDTIKFKPVNKYFKDNAKYVNRFMKHVLGWMNFGNTVDMILEKIVRYGYFFSKTYMQKSRRKTHAIRTQQGFFRRKVTYYTKEVETKKPKVDIVGNDCVLFPAAAKELTLDSARMIYTKRFFTFDKLKEMQYKGEIFNVDETLSMNLNSYFRTLSYNQASRINKDATTSPFHSSMSPVETIECYIKTDILSEEEGDFKDYYIFYCRQGKVILFMDELSNVNRFGDTFLRTGVYKRVGNSIRGSGLIEDIEDLQTEMDIIHSQRLNAQMLVIAPFFFYRPASGFKPEKIKISPGMGIPATDPSRDVYFPQLNVTNFYTSLQDETFLLSLIERKTMVSSYQLGQESNVLKSRATASGTMAIIGQGMQNFSILARRIADSVESVISSILLIYQQDRKAFDDAKMKILEEEGINALDIPESVEDILGEFQVQLSLDPATGNHFMNREIKMALFQMFVQDPFVNQDPARAWSLRKMLADAFDQEDIEELIGPKPQSVLESQQRAKEEFIMMYQGKKVAVPDNENYMAHLNEHVQQLYSDTFVTMAEEYKTLLVEHIDETQKKLYKQLMMQQMQAEMQNQINAQNPGGKDGQGNGGVIPGQSVGTAQSASNGVTAGAGTSLNTGGVSR